MKCFGFLLIFSLWIINMTRQSHVQRHSLFSAFTNTAACNGWLIYYAPPLGGGIKWWCASDICLLHTSGLSRERRGLGRQKLAQRLPTSHVTRAPFSRSKCQGHWAAFLTAVLARQAAAAVGIGMCWPWETAATLPSARWCKALRRPRGRRGAGAYCSGRRLQLVFIYKQVVPCASKTHLSWLACQSPWTG